MVKKKGKSKRTSLQDKYKIQRKIVETHRKRRKQAKKDAATGKMIPKKKDPGIPNSWPFKQELLGQLQRSKDRQTKQIEELKEKRRAELQALRKHQAEGGSARTVEELMAQATADQDAFLARQQTDEDTAKATVDGSVGQPSRRAYLKELKKVIESSDVILQVLDARDPIATRAMHPSIVELLESSADKKVVMVLNKIDLIPKAVVGDWLSYLRKSHPAIAIKANQGYAHTGEPSEDATVAAVGMDGLLQLLKNYARTGVGKNKTSIVVGVVGYPNVGYVSCLEENISLTLSMDHRKSSIVNALKRSRSVGVSPRPGFTTTMQEVVLDRNVRLLDCPGVVFNDQGAVLGNCVDVDTLEDPIQHVKELMRRCDHQSLMVTYKIPRFPEEDVMIFLALVAKSYGRVRKGGVPDKEGAARAVLKDWNAGKIPYFTPAPAILAPEGAEATVVTEMAKEFDFSQFDDVVMESLEEQKDEVDFVKLRDGPLLSLDDNMEEDTADIANAEDYDFDTMA